MSFILTLDTGAVDKLFSEESGTRVQLRQAVVAELARRIFPKNVEPAVVAEVIATINANKPELMSLLRDERHINHILRERMHEIRRSLQDTVVKTTPESSELVREIDARVKKLIEAQIEERTGSMTKMVDDAVNRVVERIEKNMERWINERVNERIQQGIDTRIDAMRKAL